MYESNSDKASKKKMKEKIGNSSDTAADNVVTELESDSLIKNKRKHSDISDIVKAELESDSPVKKKKKKRRTDVSEGGGEIEGTVMSELESDSFMKMKKKKKKRSATNEADIIGVGTSDLDSKSFLKKKKKHNESYDTETGMVDNFTIEF